MKEVVRNYSTRDLINVMREKRDKAQDYELRLFHLPQSSRPNASNAFTDYDQQQQLVVCSRYRVDPVAVKHLLVECISHCTVSGTKDL